MTENKDYLDINKANWDSRVETHFNSSFYNVEEFKKGKTSLNTIELDLLEDIAGKKIAHLQCHFGQDTLSLARLGAEVAGLDFSEKAIATATRLNQELGLTARFVCADVYEANAVLQDQFDIVYTSYGTIGWLPDLDKWAATIKHLLKPGGRLVFVEFHPVVWMFDDYFKDIAYSYFNREEIVESSNETYTDGEQIAQPKTISWNHSLSEVFQALKGQGFKVEDFNEYDYSPYDCFANTVEIGEGKFQVKGLEGKLPMVYSIVTSLH
jgi:2-polyprenyl-3-methyl-5-hydroxy-6-metoxy-1,4-benzoquinol methylase